MSQPTPPEHGTKSFRALVGTQLLGAFNDNLFKQLVLFLAARILFPGKDMQGLAFMVFSLPFVLFSGIAGDLSERYSKRNIIFNMKILEVLVMLLGTYALFTQSWYFLLFVLFVMGVQSAFFGPSKYGVIPELVAPSRLMRANGTIAMTTFLAVLLGQALAGPLLDQFSKQMWITGIVCVVFAVIGTLLAKGIGPLPQQKPDLVIKPNPFGSLFKTMKILSQEKGLMRIVVLNSMFWFDAGVIQQSITALAEKPYLNIPKNENWKLSVMMVTLAVGIIIGSLISPFFTKRLSIGRIATIGVFGMVTGQLMLLLIGVVVPGGTVGLSYAIGCMFIMGFFGAFFVVPVQTHLQNAPAPGMKGQTFAVNNFMNFLFMVIAGAFYLGARNALKLGPTTSQAIAGVLMLSFFFLNFKLVQSMKIESDSESVEASA